MTSTSSVEGSLAASSDINSCTIINSTLPSTATTSSSSTSSSGQNPQQSNVPLNNRRHPSLANTQSSTGSYYAVFGSSSTGPPTPTSMISEEDFLSPTSIAQSGKKFWFDSSSWLLSRLAYNQSSSSSAGSAQSSMDQNGTSNENCKRLSFHSLL